MNTDELFEYMQSERTRLERTRLEREKALRAVCAKAYVDVCLGRPTGRVHLAFVNDAFSRAWLLTKLREECESPGPVPGAAEKRMERLADTLLGCGQAGVLLMLEVIERSAYGDIVFVVFLRTLAKLPTAVLAPMMWQVQAALARFPVNQEKEDLERSFGLAP